MIRALDDIDQAAEDVRAALHQWSSLDLAGLYRLGWLLSTLPDRLGQVAERADTSLHALTGKDLYDDTHADAYQRLAEARTHLAETRHALAAATTAAERYHQAIGHIGTRGDDQ